MADQATRRRVIEEASRKVRTGGISPGRQGDRRPYEPANVAEGALNRLCAYDGENDPTNYATTAERIGEFLAEFTMLATGRLATIARKVDDDGGG